MMGAKQVKYKKGQYVLQEGQSTAALYQIIQVSERIGTDWNGLERVEVTVDGGALLDHLGGRVPQDGPGRGGSCDAAVMPWEWREGEASVGRVR